MDNVTHTLFAATLARTPLERAGGGTTAALIIASNIPDIDIVTTAGGALSYLRWHRGPTHGPVGIIALGLATAAIVWIGYRIAASRWSWPGAAPSFSMLAVVSTIGVMMHVLMDLPTSYGTRALNPFDWRWFAADWMPIIDVWLLIVLGAGLIAGRSSASARRRSATIVLMVMAANYGLRAAAHHQALVLAPRLFGPTLPQSCDAAPPVARIVDSWPRRTTTVAPPAGRRCLVEIAAIPTFVSPFVWRIVAQMSNAYEIHQIDLLDSRFRSPANDSDVFWRQVRRYPNVWTPAVEKAAATDVGQVYLGFSRFPAARSFVDQQGVTTVWWDDMRFVNQGIASSVSGERRTLFTAIVRIDPDGRILDARLGGQSAPPR